MSSLKQDLKNYVFGTPTIWDLIAVLQERFDEQEKQIKELKDRLDPPAPVYYGDCGY